VVLADGRKAAAKLVGTDPETDLAVIKISLDKLPVIVLGQAEQAQVGDVVLAIGNPFGVGQTVTMGIISRWAATTCTSTISRISSRPMQPSTSATRAARWSMPTATCWASTRRFIRRPAARSASALRSRIDRQER
jgi:S1-C subfamily serine protease